jgi:hypothetical protein
MKKSERCPSVDAGGAAYQLHNYSYTFRAIRRVFFGSGIEHMGDTTKGGAIIPQLSPEMAGLPGCHYRKPRPHTITVCQNS